MYDPNHPESAVSDRITPERGAHGGVYKLTAETVSPTRLGPPDKNGRRKEETVCAMPNKMFVDPSGNVVSVPVRTARVPSMEPEAARYEQITMQDQISNGSIPLESCPYSFEASHLIGSAYVLVPDGAKACQGAKGARYAADACEHMREVIKGRLEETRAKWEAELPARRSLTEDEAASMVKNMVRAFTDDGVELPIGHKRPKPGAKAAE